jgi:cell division protein FtsN/nucleoid DNA-binding protein
MILGKYIRELLDAGKRVILAGFGNLELSKPDEAQSPSGSRIDPPGISVRFDSSYSKDDGLLSSAYAEGEGLDKDEAQQRVLELIDAIKFALDRGESYTLPETGTFSRDDDGKVRFQVDPAWLIEPDQYGLESLDLLELEDLPPEEEGTESAQPEKAATVTPLAPPEPKRRPMRWRIVWMVVFLLIVVLAVLILLPPRQTEEGEGTKRFWNRNAAEEQVDLPADTSVEATETTEQKVEGEDMETPVVEEAREEVGEEPAPEEAAHQYFVIAGSFSNLGNASDLQDQLKQRGFEAEVLITENRMYRVSVASYATKAEGQQGLAAIKKQQGMESCWLLSN